MSHALRTPLNGIIGMMQLLSATGLNQDQEELINLGNISAKRLTQLLSDILDLSSIEAGKMIIREKEFDCILMDIQMPVMTRVEATRAIRELITIGAKKDIPIIAVTAHTQPGDRENFLEAGMDDYIGKPVSIEDFHRAFSKFFGDKKV
ncbi:MAG: response regulator [Desulfonatronovibrio sp. MSAO_Bac4]|nr:MAG: response regulator [Desulfonatronovibrio sp. MSAO_Bac4]